MVNCEAIKQLWLILQLSHKGFYCLGLVVVSLFYIMLILWKDPAVFYLLSVLFDSHAKHSRCSVSSVESFMGAYEGRIIEKLKNLNVEENGKGIYGYSLVSRMLV